MNDWVIWMGWRWKLRKKRVPKGSWSLINLARDKINLKDLVVRRKAHFSPQCPMAVSGWKLNYIIHFSCDYAALKFILKSAFHSSLTQLLVKVNFYYCGWLIAGKIARLFLSHINPIVKMCIAMAILIQIELFLSTLFHCNRICLLKPPQWFSAYTKVLMKHCAWD